MLSVFRSNSNNLFVVLLLAAITFVFVFTFGSWGGGNVSGDLPIAATVNGKVISKAQFQLQYANAFQTQQMFRPGFTADKAREEKLDDQVLDRLISQEILAQAAEDRGLVVGDSDVRDAIQQRVFSKEKPFDPEEYRRIVNGIYNTTEARFEDQLRRELLASRMESVITDSQHVTASEIQESFASKNDRANIEFVKIDPLHFKAKVKDASDEEVKVWTAANKPEVEKFYEGHMTRYHQDKKITARHILAKVEPDAPEADKKKAREKIEAAKKRVDGGEDFAKVATELSEDGSASQGGSLGTFGKGAMVKPFEDAAFAMQKGQVSGIVESRFGYHVIKVEDVVEPVTKELALVENDISKELMREAAQKDLARKMAEDALAQAKTTASLSDIKVPGLIALPKEGDQKPKPEDVDPYAPRVEETGMFARAARVVPRVGVSPEVVDLAFHKLSLDAPVHDGIIEVNNRFFVVRLKAREKPDEAKLASERESIEQSLLSSRRAQVVEAFVKTHRDAARIEKNGKLLN